MAYGLNDRVREQVSAFAGGTGAVTLPVVAVSGCQTFLSGWGASGTGEYCLVVGAQWETGFGTLNAGATTLTRTTVYNGSSGSGVAVNFSAGTMDCFGDIPAELAQHLNMREITVASATTCDIGVVAGSNIVVSGTTPITSFGTKANRRRYVRFSGALTLTHNATSLILPAGANIPTTAGDMGVFQSDASGNWRCVSYGPSVYLSLQNFNAGGTYTPTPGMIACLMITQGGGGGGGGAAAVGGNTGINQGGCGGSGSWSFLIATAATVGASQTVTIGAAGAGGSAGNNNGTNGGDTSVGSLCIGKGGSFGAGAANGTGGLGGAGGVAGTGTVTCSGNSGGGGATVGSTNSTLIAAPMPGAGFFGGAPVPGSYAGGAGQNAVANGGSGGSGGVAYASGGATAGGNGGAGRVIVLELCRR